jgi:hypothetical protein
MYEGLVLTVQVGQEMLRSLGQIHDSFQVDDFAGSIRNGRKSM